MGQGTLGLLARLASCYYAMSCDVNFPALSLLALATGEPFADFSRIQVSETL